VGLRRLVGVGRVGAGWGGHRLARRGGVGAGERLADGFVAENVSGGAVVTVLVVIAAAGVTEVGYISIMFFRG